MNLTVHIGTTKTGSSSIQRFLNLNRAALRRKGILIPSTLGNIVHFHSVLASLPFGKSPDLARSVPDLTNSFPFLTKYVPLIGRRQHANFCRKTRAGFLEEVANAGECKEVVITAEHLHSRLRKRKHIKTFRNMFCRDFQNVRIVVYIRPQLDQAVSLYSTMLRGGYANSLDEFIESRKLPSSRPYFDLRDVITRWTDVFGAENVIVRPFNGIDREFGVLSDFCDLLNIDPGKGGWRLDKQSNASINIAGQELLLMLNQTEALTALQRRKVVQWTEAHCTGRGAVPSLDLARSFQALFDDSNAWVIENFFPDHPEYLEPRWPKA